MVTIPYGEERAVARGSRLAASARAATEYASGDLVATSHVVNTTGSHHPDDLGNLDRTEGLIRSVGMTALAACGVYNTGDIAPGMPGLSE